jgi:hypothetical protein
MTAVCANVSYESLGLANLVGEHISNPSPPPSETCNERPVLTKFLARTFS